MILVHASSTPHTISVRSRSEMGILSRKWRTKLRISARLPGLLENSSFLFFVSDRITLARGSIASSLDHRKIRASERSDALDRAYRQIPPASAHCLISNVCEAKSSRPRWTQVESEDQFRTCGKVS